MITISINADGRITIPAAVRKQLGIKPGDKLEIDYEGDEIILRLPHVETRRPRRSTKDTKGCNL